MPSLRKVRELNDWYRKGINLSAVEWLNHYREVDNAERVSLINSFTILDHPEQRQVFQFFRREETNVNIIAVLDEWLALQAAEDKAMLNGCRLPEYPIHVRGRSESFWFTDAQSFKDWLLPKAVSELPATFVDSNGVEYVIVLSKRDELHGKICILPKWHHATVVSCFPTS